MMRTPREIAQLLGRPEPTAEQEAIICADLAHPHLVVAGAGSGKTETMANRVVYLVANHLVEPGAVLGLTFTRKAASELNARIAQRLSELAAASGTALADPLVSEAAEVSTYNAFAASVVRDHALRIGYEPDAVIIPESAAWRLAYRVVVESTDPRLAELEMSVSSIVSAVLDLARELSDHGAEPSEVAQFATDCVDRLSPLIDEVPTATARDRYRGYLHNNIGALPVFVRLAEQYQQLKRSRGFLEFSDQVALAHRIITEHPDVAELYRQRFAVVLLDEYQDTSVAQTRFLAELFSGNAVMAVGDPDQSIYGFRGASAANLSRFSADFGEGSLFQLSISWRNSHSVLGAANVVAGQLGQSAAITKLPLSSHAGTIDGDVQLAYPETIRDEAELVADWLAERLRRNRATTGEPATAALLLRAKTHLPLFADALRSRNVPVHILGMSGLLSEPVIVDLMAALAVLHSPSANAELLRLLSGARWAIGPADIAALSKIAHQLASHDERGRPLAQAERDAKRNSNEEIDTSSLVEALDAIASDAIPRRNWLDPLSTEARERLQLAGAQLAALRRRTSLKLGDLVDLVVAELQLDVEASAHPGAALAENALEAFHEVLSEFLTLSDQATLGEFLDWLRDAESRERYAARQEPAEPGTVQLMSIHAAKGLEWDYVALPRLVAAEMPGALRGTPGWLARGTLPFPFRGDVAELPQLAWRSVTDGAGLDRAMTEFVDALREQHLAEELRLGYVAVTRPKRELLLSGSWWGGQLKPRQPGQILQGIASQYAGLGEPWPEPTELDGPPELAGAPLLWPTDGLGARRAQVEQAAQLVRETDEAQLGDGALSRLIELLLREQLGDDAREPGIPVRIPASRVKDYLDDPTAVLNERRRPMPERPYQATRVGTLFHSWVEHRSSTPLQFADELVQEIDADESELDRSDAVTLDRLAELQATFEASPWATLSPLDVEREIHLPLAGNVFICKIDAVYEIGPDWPADPDRPSQARFQLVDWKTGAAPRDANDLELKQTQLALYRLAYAKYFGIDPAEIDAVFYFVADNRVVRPDHLYDELEFLSAWKEVFASGAAAGHGKFSGSVDTSSD